MPSIANVLPGDVLECDVRGRKFFALARGKAEREAGRGLVIDVDPEPVNNGRAISYRRVSGREVVAVYRKLGRARG